MNKGVCIGLVLVGIALGCGASAVAPVAATFAQGQAGWGCYVIDRFPDVRDAASWGHLPEITQGLNRVASHVQAGATLVLDAKASTSVVCVKH